MEFVFIIVIIAILVCVFTGNLGYVLYGATIVLMIVSGLLILTFAICNIILLGTKWEKASFLRLDLPTEKSKFKVAFYLVDGEEIPCLFPEEGVFVKYLYKTEKTYHVLYHPKLRRVFDRFSIATCVLGLICGIILEIMSVGMYF